jgi:hypothetical protein
MPLERVQDFEAAIGEVHNVSRGQSAAGGVSYRGDLAVQ